MWVEDEVSDDAPHNSSATDSGEVLKIRKEAGTRQAKGGGTTTSSENDDGRPRRKSSKVQSSRDRRRKRKRGPEDMDTSDGHSDTESNVRRRKKQKNDDDCDEDRDHHKSRRIQSTSKGPMTKSGGRSKAENPDSHSGTCSSPSDSNSESKPARQLSNPRKSIKTSQPQRRTRVRSPSPLDSKILGSAYLYRAVRQERVALGWSEAPCGSCPVFDFCKDGGPVDPSGCEYYGEWLKRAAITLDS
jgi:DNA-directed RNA polymerase III subunit RPC6